MHMLQILWATYTISITMGNPVSRTSCGKGRILTYLWLHRWEMATLTRVWFSNHLPALASMCFCSWIHSTHDFSTSGCLDASKTVPQPENLPCLWLRIMGWVIWVPLLVSPCCLSCQTSAYFVARLRKRNLCCWVFRHMMGALKWSFVK